MNRLILEQALSALRTRWPEAKPCAAMILGSGWGAAVEIFRILDEMPYSCIPGLGTPEVSGHAGRLVLAEVEGLPVLIFQGRRHFYEGLGWEPVAVPVFISKSIGASMLLLTNAAGGIRADFQAGDLMILEDHIQQTGSSPLIGSHDPFWGPRFPDQTRIYDRELCTRLEQAGQEAGVRLSRGVYVAVSGPCYETPAEIRAFEQMGADAIGMSTAPEAALAHAAGLRVCALSCITNRAAGFSPAQLTHEEVTATMRAAMPRMQQLLAAFWKRHHEEERTAPR